jgi:hypothetical protein
VSSDALAFVDDKGQHLQAIVQSQQPQVGFKRPTIPESACFKLWSIRQPHSSPHGNLTSTFGTAVFQTGHSKSDASDL